MVLKRHFIVCDEAAEVTPSLEYLILDLDSADSDALFIAGSASCGSWKRCFATSEKLKDVCWDCGSLQAYEWRNFSLGAGGLGSTKLALLALEYTIFLFFFLFFSEDRFLLASSCPFCTSSSCSSPAAFFPLCYFCPWWFFLSLAYGLR